MVVEAVSNPKKNLRMIYNPIDFDVSSLGNVTGRLRQSGCFTLAWLPLM